MNRFVVMAAIACFATATSAVQAEVVASYEFTGGSLASSDTSTISTASTMGLTGASGVAGDGVTITGNSAGTLSFTVTPLTTLSFLTLSMDVDATGVSFAAGDFYGLVLSAGGNTIGTLTLSFSASFPLSVPIGVTTSSPLTFQISVSGVGSTPTKAITFDNITVEAVEPAAVPLPGSLAILLSGLPMAGAGYVLRRRRKEIAKD